MLFDSWHLWLLLKQLVILLIAVLLMVVAALSRRREERHERVRSAGPGTASPARKGQDDAARFDVPVAANVGRTPQAWRGGEDPAVKHAA